MIEYLKAINFNVNDNLPEHLLSRQGIIVVRTCQRVLILDWTSEHYHLCPVVDASVSFQYFQGIKAYSFLLEVLCGLKSKLQGENEILGQFRNCLKAYVKTPAKNVMLIRILQKLLKDAKEVRSLYLSHVVHNSYGRSVMCQLKLWNALNLDTPILLVGSGQMAKDIWSKLKGLPLCKITARNQQKAKEIVQSAQHQFINWENSSEYLKYPIILMAIGDSNYQFMNAEFYRQWEEKHQNKCFIIDLGSPSSVPTQFLGSTQYCPLNQILQQSETFSFRKNQQIEKASQAIRDISTKRYYELSLSFPYDWQKLQLAH